MIPIFCSTFSLFVVNAERCCAGAAGVSPMAIVRRTWIPMTLGLITTLIFNQIFFG